ncbi:aminotransferase class I/II-fold pyridoxal phosphate-dependent enzyme [Defluviimonas sp. WL0002]|uniref:Aminotransferase class I/II-fold pyridoxal phosphate-dependent enzyme n=1 Tax=Albidovulum marisflavi TaxID=2984159 RepID=A0ABT2ZFW5_9RHOB|nr:aminotransferase class I/II-fold pyridoxal phosphate-dependent enzyme [Defluviimonas sp. WL0002]MCV2870032.1 aminotransferase class I/II-fold pyridoxal phosphate-dependent enzyme [Defluviimonas sp. WL0002]
MTDDRAIPENLVRRAPMPASVSRPVVTPIMPSVVYASECPDELDAQYEGRVKGFTYAREGHPNAEVLASKIDALEGAEGGLIVGSGMAAVSAVLLGCLKAGDHVLGGDQLYGRSLRLMGQDLPRLGISTSLADPTDASAFVRAMRPETRMVLVELVSNPTLRVADIPGIAAVCREHGVILVVDSTFSTPRAFRPFEHGADIVIHSVTKLLAGHSDVTLGYVAARDPAMRKAIYDFAVTTGMTPSPFDCWLAERGLMSFHLRYDRAEENAKALAEHLGGLPGVRRVLYPLRHDHPDHNRAAALLGTRGGNMLSFEVEGGRAGANALTRAMADLPFAPTLGDIGTILSHSASSSHRALSPEARQELGITEGFFRISVGVEDIELLKRDFSAGVAAAKAAAG